tara:strand:+ start:2367 stop:2561 length:195 start_codon:yes stop_codon:yes gene_type:complete
MGIILNITDCITNLKLRIMKNGFIEQTANDYDIPYSEAEWIYNKWNDKGLFYKKLEQFIKDRSK